MAKISIIVPYLKGPAYLEDCIQSIEDQKMDDIEVVLVDDKDGHDVPEAILQKSFVKYVRMEDEKDVDEFYEKKGIFLEERRRKRLGMNTSFCCGRIILSPMCSIFRSMRDLRTI